MTQRQVVLTVGRGKKATHLRADLLGDDVVTGGVGGWEMADATSKRTKGFAFRGTPQRTITLPLAFNGLEARGRGRHSVVEPRCRRLVAWSRPRPAAKGKKGKRRPPAMRIRGLVRMSGGRWVIESIEWGEQIRNSQGRRIQQRFTLTLVEWRPPPRKKPPAKKGKKKGKKKP